MDDPQSNLVLPQTHDSDASGAPPNVEAPSFTPLDPNVIKLWRVSSAIGSAIVLGITAIPAIIVALNAPAAAIWVLVGWLLLLALRVWLFLWYPPAAFEAWGYRIDERVLETRNGVWFRVTRLLPLSRLQHVDLHRGPFERYFGLASLVLHTAGTQQAAITIPGLSSDDATRLRDQLVTIGGDDAV